jgi:hypothetical protein
MTSIWEQLQTANVDDHRTMTQGYVELLEAIQSRDLASASRIAAELDELAGPHIEFEEQCLYPEVKKIRGDSYTSRLYDEHDEVLSALVEFKSLSPESTPDSGRVTRWAEQIQHGLDHAAACGSLLSHLQALSTPLQQQHLESLERLRKQGHRWSDLQ